VCHSKFVRKTRDLRLQKCRDLENRVMGQWRSLRMSPFDREPMICDIWRSLYLRFDWSIDRCSIVTMSLSRVVSEIFNVKKCCYLKIPVNSQSRSLKVVPFDRLCMVSYWCSIVTLSLIRTIFFRYSTTKMPWPWKPD